ncbi:MAG: M28 family peptidase, partial [Candidatus Dadabacteria bacterium]
GVCLALFDAEDGGNIDGQPWSIGARAFASSGHRCASPEGVVIVDMVGDQDLAIYKDYAVDEALQDAIWNEADARGVAAFHPQKKYAIIDDHVPFRERGIASVVLIDFDYPWWHTVSDTVDKTSAASLAAVGKVLEQWLRRGGSW